VLVDVFVSLPLSLSLFYSQRKDFGNLHSPSVFSTNILVAHEVIELLAVAIDFVLG
jgi:hypothetical protein